MAMCGTPPPPIKLRDVQPEGRHLRRRKYRQDLGRLEADSRSAPEQNTKGSESDGYVPVEEEPVLVGGGVAQRSKLASPCVRVSPGAAPNRTAGRQGIELRTACPFPPHSPRGGGCPRFFSPRGGCRYTVAAGCTTFWLTTYNRNGAVGRGARGKRESVGGVSTDPCVAQRVCADWITRVEFRSLRATSNSSTMGMRVPSECSSYKHRGRRRNFGSTAVPPAFRHRGKRSRVLGDTTLRVQAVEPRRQLEAVVRLSTCVEVRWPHLREPWRLGRWTLHRTPPATRSLVFSLNSQHKTNRTSTV